MQDQKFLELIKDNQDPLRMQMGRGALKSSSGVVFLRWWLTPDSAGREEYLQQLLYRVIKAANQ